MTAADRLEAAAQALHAADTGSLLDWPALSETARDEYRRTARIVAVVYEPLLAKAEARDELAEAADALLRCVLADALADAPTARTPPDAGAWQVFVERALTIPTTPGVVALRRVVACARAAVRPLTPAEAAGGQDGRDRIALEAALARLDACGGALGGSPKEGT